MASIIVESLAKEREFEKLDSLVPEEWPEWEALLSAGGSSPEQRAQIFSALDGPAANRAVIWALLHLEDPDAAAYLAERADTPTNTSLVRARARLFKGIIEAVRGRLRQMEAVYRQVDPVYRSEVLYRRAMLYSLPFSAASTT